MIKAAGLGLLVIVWWLVLAADSPSPSPPRTPSPAPTPTPRPGQIFLSPVAGAGGTKLTANGSEFSPNQQVILYWDLPGRVLKTGTAGPDGTFHVEVTAPTDPDGPHLVCVQAPVAPCATFTVVAAPVSSPTPSLTPSPTPSPSATTAPSPSVSAVGAAVPGNGGDSALSILLRPPFVIFPILVLLAAVGLVVYLVWLGRTAESSPTRVTLDSRPPATPPAPTHFHPPGGDSPAGAPPGPRNPESPRSPRAPRPPNYPTDAPPDLPQAGE